MAGADIDIVLRSDSRDVDAMMDRVNTFISPMGLMGFLSVAVTPFLKRRAVQRFQGEGDDVVGRWAPLADTTQEFRAHSNLPIAPDHPINRRTDDLYDYVTGSQGAVLPLGGFGAQLTYPGSPSANPWTQEKVKTAQSGKPRPRTVPRPVLGVGMTDLLYVMAQLATGVRAAAR